jgi:hypothetical protein
MPLCTIDSLHPSRLRCELCRLTVAALPDDDEAPPYAVTGEQAGHLWPQLAGAVLEHELWCPRKEAVAHIIRLLTMD